MTKARHVLGISGGKDSAALAIYLSQRHPNLNIDYYFCDTGKELDETYEVIDKLESVIGKQIKKLDAAEGSALDNPFDHFLEMYGGFLPSSQARWCTKKLKLEPFESHVGDLPTISYVGIRGDEDREGYISKKSNIQSIFPFRQNIWSEDVIAKVLANTQIDHLYELYKQVAGNELKNRLVEVIKMPLSGGLPQEHKLQNLLDLGTAAFNHVVFAYLKDTTYPLALESDFPLLDNEDVLIKADIFKLLEESGVGVPKYYQNIEFEIDGEKSSYARSRSGCYFCFFQQKIEWVWLLENHPELYTQAMAYEKDGFTWGQTESLEELAQPDRVASIKREFVKRTKRAKTGSGYLIDILDGEGEGCAACFI